MKTFAKILAIIFGILLILIIVLPIAFRGRIVDMVRTQIDQSVEARVDFGDFSLSLIRNFPNLSVTVDDISVVGINDFENDTLARIGQLALTFDLMSLLGDDPYQVKSITLDDPHILLKVLPEGTANWDVVPSDTLAQPQDTTGQEPFRLTLQRVEINNGYLVYHDDLLTTYITADDLDAVLRGDLSTDITTLATRDATIGAFSLRYETMPILSQVNVNLTAELDADLNNFIFTFRDNLLVLNELPVHFDGMIGMPEEDIQMDFTFDAPESEFRHFLSLIPAIYTTDFEQLSTSGTLQLEGFVKGTYNDDQVPAFGLDLAVNDGMFRYPDLPAAVSEVNIVADISNPGQDIDLTVIDIPVFSLNMGGQPFEARLNLATPISDPQLDAMVRGMIDLGQIHTFYPLGEEVTLTGTINSDLQARGRLSALEQERYQDFQASGSLQVDELQYRSPDFGQGVEVPQARLQFSPRHMALSAFEMRLGESDLAATGRIDNMLGYLLDDQLLTGSFQVRSSFFNLNQLMEEAPQDTVADQPMELSVIEVPDNIDFSLDADFESILFGELNINDVSGRIHVVDEQVLLQDVLMHLLGGSLILNGTYSTRNEEPRVEFAMDVRQFNIQETFNQFNTVQALAPIGRYAEGTISANLDLNTLLSDSLMPVLSSVAARGSLRSSDLQVQNAPAMNQLASRLNLDLFREMALRDLNLSFRVNEGKVEVEPFTIRFGESQATIRGNHFLDQRMEYVMDVQIPRKIFGSRANDVLDRLVGQAAVRGFEIDPGENVSLDVAIGGTFSDPEVRFDLSQVTGNIRNQLKEGAEGLIDETRERVREEAQKARDNLENQVEEQIDETRESLQKELNARAEKVIEQAEAQAARIREEARRGAEKIREEARQQALRLEEEASGRLAQAAARRAGETLVREAAKRADALEEAADKKAQQVLEEARQQAEGIRQGEQQPDSLR